MNRAHRIGALVATTLLTLAAMSSTAPVAGAQADEVEVTLAPGLLGVVSPSRSMPVRVTLQSDSSRTVELEVTTSLGNQFYQVELNAGAPTQTDAVIQGGGGVEATVRDPAGDKLGSAQARPDPKTQADNVVGVGTSIATDNKPWVVPSIAKIDEATLIPTDTKLLERPGALGALNALVLGPADVERLSDEQRRQVSAWVAEGGNLALDQARTDPLPILDTAAEEGNRTAVGTGWVRFTDGTAAKGNWSQVVEPATATDSGSSNDDMFIDDMGFGGPNGFYDDVLSNTGFLQISYLPSWVIGLAVLATALLVGPILWFVLRSRKRRRWMWVAAPTLSLCVAGALLLVGRGALADASTTAQGSAMSTEWGTRGEFGLGTTRDDATLELGGQGQVWASKPKAPMSGSGAELRAIQPLGLNTFGYAGIGRIMVDDGPVISVAAVDQPDGKVNVSVTNNSTGTLTGLAVAGFSRQRGFDDVAPGATETMEFEASNDLAVFGGVFPFGQAEQECFDMFCGRGGAFGRGEQAPAAQRGRISITGNVRTPMNVGGNSHVTLMQVTATAPVVPPDEDPKTGAGTSIKVETVGERIVDQDRNVQIVQNGVEFGPGEIFEEDGEILQVEPNGDIAPLPEPLPGDSGPVTTVAPLPGEPGGAPVPPAPPAPEVVSQDTYVMISSPVDLPSAECAIHTVIGDAKQWSGTKWETLPTKGDRYMDKRFQEPNEAQRYPLPALKAGDEVFLRFSSNLPSNPATAINCSEAK